MGVLDILTDPRLAAGAAMLGAGEANQSTGQGLLAGIGAAQQGQRFQQNKLLSGLQQKGMQQTIKKRQRELDIARQVQRIRETNAPRTVELEGPTTTGQPLTGVLPGADPLQTALQVQAAGGDITQDIGLLNALKTEQASAVTAASPAGKLIQDYKNGFLSKDQLEDQISKSLDEPKGSRRVVKLDVNGESHAFLVDDNGNKVDLGVASPGTPLIDLGGVTKAQRGRMIMNRDHLKSGRILIDDIISGIETGEEPLGVTRNIVGGIQGGIDQLRTAADEVTDGASSRALKSIADSFSSFSKVLKKDIDSGVISKEQAKGLKFVDSNIAVTDLKRNILTYMVARLNVGSGQKITNQMISEAREQTQLGGIGGGGKEIGLARYKALGSLFDSRINALNTLIDDNGGKTDISAELKALQEALGINRNE